MNLRISVQIVVFAAVFCSAACWAHNEEEYLYKARSMIGTLLSSGWDSEEEMLEHQQSDDPLYHWNYTSQDDFFGFFVTNGWTRGDCEMAFDKYLSWISTNDMSVVDSQERMFARGAIAQCESLKYTKAMGTIRTYALNPTVDYRFDAFDMVIDWGSADESLASFFEAIATNRVQFSEKEIQWVVPAYCKKLLSINTNNLTEVSARDRSARIFYANRFDWRAGTALDSLFVSAFPAYCRSSNRLEYANYVLSRTQSDWHAMRNYFASVTNELISSGQPLVELNLDESTSP